MQYATQPYNKAVAITTSNTANFPELDGPCAAIYVGTKGATGTVVGVFQNGFTATFVGMIAGTIYPFAFKRVNSTTTDASDLLALYYV